MGYINQKKHLNIYVNFVAWESTVHQFLSCHIFKVTFRKALKRLACNKKYLPGSSFMTFTCSNTKHLLMEYVKSACLQGGVIRREFLKMLLLRDKTSLLGVFIQPICSSLLHVNIWPILWSFRALKDIYTQLRYCTLILQY